MGNVSGRRSGARGTPRCRPRSGAGQSAARARSGAERGHSRRCCRRVTVAVLPPLPPGSEGGARGFGWKNDKGGAARRRNSLRICREPPVRPFSGAVFPLLLGSRGEGAGSGAAGLRVGGCGGLRGRGGPRCGAAGGARRAWVSPCRGGGGWAWPGPLVPPPEMQQSSPFSSLREVGALRWRRGSLCQGFAPAAR